MIKLPKKISLFLISQLDNATESSRSCHASHNVEEIDSYVFRKALMRKELWRK